MLETAYQDAADGGKSKKALMYQREEELEEGISLLAAYVQNASGGDAAKIRNSGFEVRNTPRRWAHPNRLQT